MSLQCKSMQCILWFLLKGGECSHWHYKETEIHYHRQTIQLNELYMHGNNLGITSLAVISYSYTYSNSVCILLCHNGFTKTRLVNTYCPVKSFMTANKVEWSEIIYNIQLCSTMLCKILYEVNNLSMHVIFPKANVPYLYKHSLYHKRVTHHVRGLVCGHHSRVTKKAPSQNPPSNFNLHSISVAIRF